MTSPAFTRRALIAGLAATAALPGMTARSAEGDMRVLAWPGITAKRVLAPFESGRGVRVAAQNLNSNDEIFILLRAGGDARYDVVTPWHGVVPALAEEGLLQPLDLARLPALGGLQERFRVLDWATVDGQVYAVPVLLSMPSMVVAGKHLAVPPGRWDQLFDEPFAFKIAFIDDALATFAVWARALGIADPARMTMAELSQVQESLIALKRSGMATFGGSAAGIASALSQGTAWLTLPAWPGIAAIPEAKSANAYVHTPEPGSIAILITLAIPANAPKSDLAYDLLNHLLLASTQLTLAKETMHAVLHPEAVGGLDPELRNLYPYDDWERGLARSPLFAFPPLGRDDSGTAAWVDWVGAWDRLRWIPVEARPTATPKGA